MPIDNFLLPWSLDSALFALGFYAIGNLSSGYIANVINKIKSYRYKTVLCVELIILIMIILMPLAMMNGKITLGSKILNNGFLLYLNGILGTILILIMSVLFEKNRFLIFCGRNSFSIMASHYLFRNYIVKPVHRLVTGEMYDRESLTDTIVPFLAVFSLSFLFAIVYNMISKKYHSLCKR